MICVQKTKIAILFIFTIYEIFYMYTYVCMLHIAATATPIRAVNYLQRSSTSQISLAIFQFMQPYGHVI